MTTLCLHLLVGALLVPGAPASQAAATQPSGPAIEGMVVNSLGAGVKGARVTLHPSDRPDAQPLCMSTTNATGDFVLRLPRPLSEITSFHVRVSAVGYTEFRDEVEVDPEDPPFIDVQLAGAARIVGQVRTFDTNEPVAGVRILCANLGRELETTTDARGRYVLNEISKGSAVLTLNSEGWGIQRRALDVTEDETQVIFEVRPERRVELTIVTDADEPAPNVQVDAITKPESIDFTAVSDDDGRAMLRGLSSDVETVRVRLNGPGYVQMPEFEHSFRLPPVPPATREQEKARSPVKHRLVVERAAAIRGRVVSADGEKPIVGVRVVSGQELHGQMPMIWTSLDGTYELDGLQPGENQISFQHPDFAVDIRKVALKVGEKREINVRLETGRPISGKVVFDGKPVEDVWVTAEMWKGYRTLGMRTITDENGRFEFSRCPEGEIEVSFHRAGFLPLNMTFKAGQTDQQVALERMFEAKEIAPGDNKPKADR